MRKNTFILILQAAFQEQYRQASTGDEKAGIKAEVYENVWRMFVGISNTDVMNDLSKENAKELYQRIFDKR